MWKSCSYADHNDIDDNNEDIYFTMKDNDHKLEYIDLKNMKICSFKKQNIAQNQLTVVQEDENIASGSLPSSEEGSSVDNSDLNEVKKTNKHDDYIEIIKARKNVQKILHFNKKEDSERKKMINHKENNASVHYKDMASNNKNTWPEKAFILQNKNELW